MMDAMSETTKRRGRPPTAIGLMAKDPEYAQIFGGNLSERQMMNHAHAQIGLKALGLASDKAGVDAEFRWLFDPSARVCRSSLLTEIGRIVGEYATREIGTRHARAVARAICRHKPSVAKGRALIRAWRTTGLWDADPVESLAATLERAVVSWSETHEALEIERITEAMQRALCRLSETVTENTLEQFDQAVDDCLGDCDGASQ